MPVNDAWSEDFFDGPWIDLHLALRSPSDIERETDAIVEILDPGGSLRIIDLPCGPGDHAVELALRGHDVTGVDRSEELLAHAIRRARDAHVSATFEAGDMRTFRSPTTFDALICMWGSFGYFDAEGDLAQLHTFRELLRPDGTLLLDLLPLEGILVSFEPHDSQRIGRMIVTQKRSYDMHRQRIDGVWTFHRDDERIERRTSMRLYTIREALEMLRVVGFEDVDLFDPETRAPFALGATRTWLRARRR